jgi:hypothetical protein
LKAGAKQKQQAQPNQYVRSDPEVEMQENHGLPDASSFGRRPHNPQNMQRAVTAPFFADTDPTLQGPFGPVDAP